MTTRSADLRRLPTDLEHVFLGDERRYTREEVCRLAGVELTEARRLWRAMGFGDVGDAARVFTDADVAALRLVSSLRRRGVLDLETTIHLTRALGRMTGRLVEWQIQTLVERVAADGLPAEVAFRAGVEQAATLVSELERLLGYVWRRKLAAAANRTLWDADEDLELDQATVGFADLVGFARLAHRLQESELAAVIETFEARTSDIVAAAGGRVVKTMGDEVLFLAGPPAVGADIALQIAAAMTAEPIVPKVRVGVATGTVLYRLGDVFGTTVNIASRLTSHGRPGTVYVDGAMAAALASEPAYALRRAWRRELPGVGLIEAWLLQRARMSK
jgi:adenylate cyclase